MDSSFDARREQFCLPRRIISSPHEPLRPLVFSPANAIGPEGAALLAEGFRSNATITSLDIRGNPTHSPPGPAPMIRPAGRFYL